MKLFRVIVESKKPPEWVGGRFILDIQYTCKLVIKRFRTLKGLQINLKFDRLKKH
jgi:hypothetical protein